MALMRNFAHMTQTEMALEIIHEATGTLILPEEVIKKEYVPPTGSTIIYHTREGSVAIDTDPLTSEISARGYDGKWKAWKD
jgi:hypothetical protein